MAKDKTHTYLVIAREGQPEQIVIWDTLRIRIGRHPEQDLMFPESEISREHALLQRDGHEFSVEDLNTANHTYVNGEQIKRVLLADNDVIEVGSWKIQFFRSKENPVLTSPNAKYASQLKDYRVDEDEEGERTMLGLGPDDEFPDEDYGVKKRFKRRNLKKQIENEKDDRELDLMSQGIEVLKGLPDVDTGAPASSHSEEPPPTVPVFRENPDPLTALAQSAAKMVPPAPPQSPPPAAGAPTGQELSDFDFGVLGETPAQPPVPPAAPPHQVEDLSQPPPADPAPVAPVAPAPPVPPTPPAVPVHQVEDLSPSPAPDPAPSAAAAAPVPPIPEAASVPQEPASYDAPTEPDLDSRQAPAEVPPLAASQPLSNFELTLQLRGVSPEVLELLRRLQDKELDLSELSIVLKSIVQK